MAEKSNETLVQEIQNDLDVQQNLEQLYLQNETMIRKAAEGFLWSGEELSDLMQSGWIGMQRSVEKYDPGAGASFLTYSLFWVRQEIRRHIENSGSLVRLPSGRQEQLYLYRKFVTEYKKQHNGEDPDPDLVCAELEISRKQLDNILDAERIQYIDSLDRPVDGTDDLMLSDTLEGPQNVSGEVTDKILADDIKDQIQMILDALQKDQRTAVVETVMNCRTLEEVGQELGVRSQRVAQLRDLAIRKMQKSRHFRKLQQDCFDLYGMAVRRSSLSVFRNTRTSSTEYAAMRLLDAENELRQQLDFCSDLSAVKTWIIKVQLQRSDRPTAIGVIKELVSDPELQRILIRVIVNGEKIKDLRDVDFLKYRNAMSALHMRLSKMCSDRPTDGPDQADG